MFKRIYKLFQNLKHIISNYFLCLKYPFLKISEEYKDPYYTRFNTYQYTWLDDVPEGWKGLAMDMFEELKKTGIKFYFTQIKEKFGCLTVYFRLYKHSDVDWHTIENIIEKYSEMSSRVCIACGKPAEYISQGWISPFCIEHIGTRKYTKINHD